MEQYKSIGLQGFDYKFFEEEEVVWVGKRIDWYPHSKHLIELCPGAWEEQLEKNNEQVHGKNQH